MNEKERLIVISAIAEMAKSKACCNSLGVQGEMLITTLTKETLDAIDMVNSHYATSELKKDKEITVFFQKIENYLHHQLVPQVVAELIASLPGELIQQSSAHKICSTD